MGGIGGLDGGRPMCRAVQQQWLLVLADPSNNNSASVGANAGWCRRAGVPCFWYHRSDNNANTKILHRARLVLEEQFVRYLLQARSSCRHHNNNSRGPVSPRYRSNNNALRDERE